MGFISCNEDTEEAIANRLFDMSHLYSYAEYEHFAMDENPFKHLCFPTRKKGYPILHELSENHAQYSNIISDMLYIALTKLKSTFTTRNSMFGVEAQDFATKFLPNGITHFEYVVDLIKYTNNNNNSIFYKPKDVKNIVGEAFAVGAKKVHLHYSDMKSTHRIYIEKNKTVQCIIDVITTAFNHRNKSTMRLTYDANKKNVQKNDDFNYKWIDIQNSNNYLKFFNKIRYDRDKSYWQDFKEKFLQLKNKRENLGLNSSSFLSILDTIEYFRNNSNVFSS